MTLPELYKSFVQSFEDISDSPAADARILICTCLGLTQTQLALATTEEVPADKLPELDAIRTARSAGKPVAYLTGERGFYESMFKVTEDTLIPRADTETLVEEALADIVERYQDQESIRILDLCCGTGCIGISVAKVLSECFDSVSLTLADLSEKAMEVCRENAEELVTEENIDLEFVVGDLFDCTGDEPFDVILSNPPYIPSAVVPTLEKQVRFEPLMALDGGTDGLDFVRAISRGALTRLVPGGLLEMEIGYDQGPAATSILEGDGYSEVSIVKDLGDNDRVVKGYKD
jgi:release factor glutamine methyltransferase